MKLNINTIIRALNTPFALTSSRRAKSYHHDKQAHEAIYAAIRDAFTAKTTEGFYKGSKG